jgi:hypothetical protein
LFSISAELKNIHENGNNIRVNDKSSEAIIVHCQFTVLVSANNQLGVMYNPHAQESHQNAEENRAKNRWKVESKKANEHKNQHDRSNTNKSSEFGQIGICVNCVGSQGNEHEHCSYGSNHD